MDLAAAWAQNVVLAGDLGAPSLPYNKTPRAHANRMDFDLLVGLCCLIMASTVICFLHGVYIELSAIMYRLRALEGIDVSLEDIADSLGRIERNGLPITDAPQV